MNAYILTLSKDRQVHMTRQITMNLLEKTIYFNEMYSFWQTQCKKKENFE
jgi:hypothetical protein